VYFSSVRSISAVTLLDHQPAYVRKSLIARTGSGKKFRCRILSISFPFPFSLAIWAAERCQLPQRSTGGFWCILSWKLRSRYGAFTCTVICIGPTIYQYDVSQKRSGGMVSSLTKEVPVWYTVPYGPNHSFQHASRIWKIKEPAMETKYYSNTEKRKIMPAM